MPRMKQMDAEKDGPVVRGIKWGQALILRVLFPIRYAVFAVFGLLLGLGVWVTVEFGQAFLPEFNEGALNVSVVMAPGTALAESNRIATTAERLVRVPVGLAVVELGGGPGVQKMMSTLKVSMSQS
ncbi:MAG: hypothetical protein ACPHGY_09720 [Rhodospirillaceae bacterium]